MKQSTYKGGCGIHVAIEVSKKELAWAIDKWQLINNVMLLKQLSYAGAAELTQNCGGTIN